MRLKEWAERNGVAYITAWRWHDEGRMPVPSRKVNGVIMVDVDDAVTPSAGRRVVYARVSSSDQKADLDRQVSRMVQQVGGADGVVTEVGSALNGGRRKFLALLGDADVAEIVVEHRDRAMRFGFEYVEAALGAQGRKITVLDTDEVEDDLVRDMTEVLTSFCARLYGKRAAANRARRALEAAAAAQ